MLQNLKVFYELSLREDRKFVWHPFTQMKTSGDALPIVSGKGSLIFDENGKAISTQLHLGG